MPKASCAAANAPFVPRAGAAFSSAPMLLPSRLVRAEATPRLNEPTSRRKRLRYCAPTGSRGAKVPVRSVESSAPAGGEVKSFTLTVQLMPPWQLAQPALKNRLRPWAMSEVEGAPGSQGNGRGELG